MCPWWCFSVEMYSQPSNWTYLIVRVKCSNNSPFLSGEDFKVYPFVLMSADVEHIEYFLVTGGARVVSHSYRGKRLVSLSFSSFTIKAITYSHISCVIRSTSRERFSTLHIDHVSWIVRASRALSTIVWWISKFMWSS